MSKEVLRQALEVMRNQGDVSVDEWIATEKAIEEALNEYDDLTIAYMAGLNRGKDIAKQKTLTDEELYKIYLKHYDKYDMPITEGWAYERAIIDAAQNK